MARCSRAALKVLCTLVIVGGLAACSAGQKYTYYDNAMEVPQGPGLLTGDQGSFEFTIKRPGR